MALAIFIVICSFKVNANIAWDLGTTVFNKGKQLFNLVMDYGAANYAHEKTEQFVATNQTIATTLESTSKTMNQALEVVKDLPASHDNSDIIKALGMVSQGVIKIDSSVQQLDQNVSVLSDKVANAGNSVGKNVEKVAELSSGLKILSGITAVSTSIIAGGIVIKAGHSVYRYFRPTEEDKKSKKKTSRKLKSMETKDRLNTCLVQNTNGKMNSDGFPCLCEEAAQFYAQAAGFEKLDRIKKAFKVR